MTSYSEVTRRRGFGFRELNWRMCFSFLSKSVSGDPKGLGPFTGVGLWNVSVILLGINNVREAEIHTFELLLL
jgi:hypothetical protein